MEQDMQVHFDKLEASFKDLIESITTYNPSIKAAEEILELDEDLSRGLEKLVHHQHNHARLLQLRQSNAQLDAQIKAMMTKLASARKELQMAQWTELLEDSNKVPMHELLGYAKRISKFSLPPDYRGVPAIQASTTFMDADPTSTPSRQTANKSPILDQYLADKITDRGATRELVASEGGRGAMWDAVPELTRAWLDQVRLAEFVPWPNHELIRNGALGDIQGQLERGEDPRTTLTTEQRELLEREREECESKETELDRREREERERIRRGGMREAVAGEQKSVPAGPQLTGFGMFAEDEDE